MIYSIRELIAKLEDLKEEGYKTLSFLELLELIGFEKKDLIEVLKIYDEGFILEGGDDDK